MTIERNTIEHIQLNRVCKKLTAGQVLDEEANVTSHQENFTPILNLNNKWRPMHPS